MKLDKWKQKTPYDQLVSLRNGFEGNILNYEIGIITKEQILEITFKFLEELKTLEPYLKHPDTW